MNVSLLQTLPLRRFQMKLVGRNECTLAHVLGIEIEPQSALDDALGRDRVDT